MYFRLLLLLACMCCSLSFAKVVEYSLTVSEQAWAPSGMKHTTRSLTLNGSIPGPTLRFGVGDVARIRVHNALARESTSLHWHGLLVPNNQDGVPDLNTPPILPGATYTFEFPLKHAGTYWYHSHTGLQEQMGVYGAIVVEPRDGGQTRAASDHVLVLSDWTRENPSEVMRTLMRGSEWYGLKKGTAQSLLGAYRADALTDYFARERSRMPAMDISDIAYDAFLINGHITSELPAANGKTVRLRLINASAATYFYLQSATGPLKIIAADGPAVRPIRVNRLLIGIGETYDVLVTVPGADRWEIRATAQDGSGHASTFIGRGEAHLAPDIPRPDLYRMDASVLASLDENERPPLSDSQALAAEIPRPLSPYSRLRATRQKAIPASQPRRTIPLRLTGDMERYIWSFNGKTLNEDGVIKVKRGEVLRLELVNDTMMHHPIHLHGHFFRVLEREISDAPLKHTIDVPPMGRRTIEFEANESGDWVFHCHLLYHMHAGMTRVFSYAEQGPDHIPDLGEMGRDPILLMLDGSVQTHMTMGMASLMNSRNDFFAMWDIGYMKNHDGGSDYHFHTEVDVGWKRYFTPNFSSLLGWRFTNDDEAENRAFAGVDYRLPYLIRTSLQMDSEGDARITAAKSLQLTDRLGLFAGFQYDTGSQWEWTLGADYTLTKQFSLISQYTSDHGFGGGISFRF
jgi:FtsP/CotA-like multicopper oxidase with cupredoxin domain